MWTAAQRIIELEQEVTKVNEVKKELRTLEGTVSTLKDTVSALKADFEVQSPP